MKKLEKVAVVKCSSYEQKKVDKAIKKALELINFDFKRGSKVLIKPNVVGGYPKNQIAITTHPSVIEAVCKILRQKKCRIYIGDSPFTNPYLAFKKSGIEKIAKKYAVNKKPTIFEQEKLIKIKDKKAKVLKNLSFAKIIKQADVIINVPKMKTHILTKYTGAIKNLYGIMPGGLKQKLHMKAKGDKKFSHLLVDIYQNVEPELTIIDGIIGMDGNGPTSGNPKKAGLILASRNGIALDIAVCKIIDLNPKKVYMIKFAVKRKLNKGYKFELAGLDKLPKIVFKIPTPKAKRGAKKMISKLFKEKPFVVDTTKCIKCGLCASKCPVHAITLKPYPTWNKKRCIRCFCCMEICPQHAISLGK